MAHHMKKWFVDGIVIIENLCSSIEKSECKPVGYKSEA